MSEDPTTRQLVVCAVAGDEYALPIEQVREIVRASTPRAVASDVPWVRGVIGLRGTLVPVYDLAARLRLEARPSERAKIVIALAPSGDLAGLLVDDVVEVLTVPTDAVEDVPATGVDAIAAIAKLEERLVLVLDLPLILDAGAAPAAAA